MSINGWQAASKIQRLKELSGLSNTEIARYVGVSHRRVHQWENGGKAGAEQADALDRLIFEIETETPRLVRDWLLDIGLID